MRKYFKIIIIIITLFTASGNLLSQWKKIDSIPDPFKFVYWLDVYFLEENPNYGWVCGFGGNTIRTTDGGISWIGNKIELLSIDSVFDGSQWVYDTTRSFRNTQLESIHFANEKVGYTSGTDSIFKTTDGGATWKSIVRDTLMRIWGTFFLNSDTGMCVGGGCDGGKQYFNRTTDGGKTWTSFNRSVPDAGLTDVILYSADGIGYASSSGLIWKTVDGGRTWFPFATSGNSDWQEEITNYGKTFLVPYSVGCAGGGNNGGLRMSTDDGNSWREFEIGEACYGTFLVDSKRGWGCGSANSVYYTSDGGVSWVLRNCGIDANSALDDIWFINDTLGWVVGRGVYKTHYYDTVNPKILADKSFLFCEGDTLKLESDKDYNYYRWSTGDTTKSIYIIASGKYSLIAYNHICDKVYPDSINVDIFPKTDVRLVSDKKPEICEGDSILLWVDNIYVDITWSTLDKKDTIMIKKSGTYYVTITDTNGCDFSKSINVIVHALPDVKILNQGKLRFCLGDSVKLQTNGNYQSYYWFETSNPDIRLSDEKSIVIKSTGVYSVIVENDFGCKDTADAVLVDVLDLQNRLKIFADDLKKELDFDTLGLTAMRCLPLRVSNLSSVPLALLDIYVTGNIEFSIPQAQLPMSLNPGDTNKLIVCFRPIDFKMRRDTLVIGDTCNSHIIPLSGYGIKNTYIGESNCEVDIKVRTHGVLGGEYYIIGNAYPNPSGVFLEVSFNIKSKEPVNIISGVLRNIIGNKVLEGQAILDKLNSTEGIYFSDGFIRFETSELPSGTYSCEINISGVFKSIPVIIAR